jgi:hypothetical protein
MAKQVVTARKTTGVEKLRQPANRGGSDVPHHLLYQLPALQVVSVVEFDMLTHREAGSLSGLPPVDFVHNARVVFEDVPGSLDLRQDRVRDPRAGRSLYSVVLSGAAAAAAWIGAARTPESSTSTAVITQTAADRPITSATPHA